MSNDRQLFLHGQTQRRRTVHPPTAALSRDNQSKTSFGTLATSRRKMKTNDAIVRAVALLRSRPDLDDVGVYRVLAGQGVERPMAARLVQFLPMIYCRLIFLKSGLRFPETYRRVLADGTYSCSVSLSGDSLWNEASKFAEAEIESGANSQSLLAIASRSAEFDAANKLLNSGGKLEDIKFTEPLLLWPTSGPDS